MRKLTVLVLLLLIPLQGAAASLSVLQCPPADAGAAYAPNGDDGEPQRRDGDISNTSHDHFFCHQSFSGIPVLPLAAAKPDLAVLETLISLPASLFLPEQPQRPPFFTGA